MKNKGNGIIALGLLLIAAALGLSAYNQRQAGQAGEEAQLAVEALMQTFPASTEETLPPAVASDNLPEETQPLGEMPTTQINGQEYIGVLAIPALSLELPVMSTWSYPQLRIAPCRYTGSVYQGNMTVCAHNYVTHFGNLKNLHIGDDVTFTDVEGNVYSYQVLELETLRPNQVEEMTEGDWDLTLFTCTIGGATRITVRCEEVK